MESRAKRHAPSPYEYANAIYAGSGFTIEMESTTSVRIRHYLRASRVVENYASSIIIGDTLHILKFDANEHWVVTMNADNSSTLIPASYVSQDWDGGNIPHDEFWMFPSRIIMFRHGEQYSLSRFNIEYMYSIVGDWDKRIYHWRAVPNTVISVSNRVEIKHTNGNTIVRFPIHDQFLVMQHNILLRYSETRHPPNEFNLSDDHRYDTWQPHALSEIAADLTTLTDRDYMRGTPNPMPYHARDVLIQHLRVGVYCDEREPGVHSRSVGYLRRRFVRPVGYIIIEFTHLPWLSHIMEDPDTLFGRIPRDIRDIIARYLLPPTVHVTTIDPNGKYRIYGHIPTFEL